MILIGLLENFGILLLLPLISLTGFLEGVQSYENSHFDWFISLFNTLPQSLSLIVLLLLFVLIMVGQALFQRQQTILNTKIQQGFTRYLREKTYKALMQANWSFYLRKRKSDLINTMVHEIARVSGGTQFFLQFISSFVFTLVQISIAFWLSAEFTIFVLIFGALLILLSRGFVKNSKQIGGNTVELGKTYLGVVTDHLNGMKEIKSNSLEASHIRWFHSLNEKMEKNMIEISKLKTTSRFVFKSISAVLIAVFVFISIKMFETQPAQLMVILIIFSRIWPRITSIQSSMEQLSSVIPSFNALIELQKECLESQELEDIDNKNLQSHMINHGIECRNINYRYNTNKELYALKDINLKIPCNQMTAIVGPSGAGKSTLIDLLMGLNKPEYGEILIDDVPLSKNNLLDLRSTISYVSQDPFLFNGTIRENLLMIVPHAREEQLWEALEFSSAAEFVKKLPLGLDTLIGDRGIRLSGGERQRIVLARAILRKPSILVLDEATSALDTENERKIQEAIDQLKGKMTIIVIAHRLSTIRNADQVIVLEKGKVVQRGGFKQLAEEKRGLFRHLLGSQQAFALKE